MSGDANCVSYELQGRCRQKSNFVHRGTSPPTSLAYNTGWLTGSTLTDTVDASEQRRSQ